MRNKKAKQLRKIARGVTVGKPNLKYKLATGNHWVLNMCTRKVYQDIKRKYLNQSRGLI